MSDTGRQKGQALWRALYYFNLYRLCLGVGFFALALGKSDIGQFGERIPDLFTTASAAMVAMAILNMVTITRGQPAFRQQAYIQFSMDAVLITVLSFSSGGISSGVNLLLIVSVAAGGVVLSGRMSLFFAALATVLTLIEHLLSESIYGPQSSDYSSVGLLGVALFGTGLLVYVFAFRIRKAEALVEKSAADLASLARLNEMVVDRLEIGVVVVNAAGGIKFLNDGARTLLRPADGGTLPPRLPAAMQHALDDWHLKPEGIRELDIEVGGGKLAVRIEKIGDNGQGDTVVFLEDLTQTERRAQQLKLAALGRLTAALAHEIRNPLAAISHANELLGESDTLQTGDRALVDIIQRHSNRINQIISSILELGKPGSAALARFELEPWLHEFRRNFAESHDSLPQEAIELGGDNMPPICANPDHLTQILTNLCENALRHAPSANGEPPVRLKSGMEPDARAAYLDVISPGPAIAEDIREKMFEPFFSTDGKGLGLGLYLSRELCQNDYGRLDYVAKENGGYFRIQFAPSTICE